MVSLLACKEEGRVTIHTMKKTIIYSLYMISLDYVNLREKKSLMGILTIML